MRNLRFTVSVAGGFGIVLGIIVYLGLDRVLENMGKIGLEYFLLFLGLQIVLMLLWAVKWWIVLSKFRIPLKTVLPVSVFGYFMNNMTPVGMAGGEPARAYVLSKVADISTEDSAATVIVDLFLEILPLLCMILAAIYYIHSFGVGVLLSGILWLAAVLAVILLGFILLLALKERLAAIIICRTLNLCARIPAGFLKTHALDARTRVEGIISSFMDSMRTALTDTGIMFWGTVLSSLVWAVNFLRVYLIFRMLEVDLTIPHLVVARVSVLSISFMSIIPGAVGFWEGSTTLVFSLFGVPAATAMAAVLIERFFSYFIANIIGGLSAGYLGYNSLISRRE